MKRQELPYRLLFYSLLVTVIFFSRCSLKKQETAINSSPTESLQSNYDSIKYSGDTSLIYINQTFYNDNINNNWPMGQYEAFHNLYKKFFTSNSINHVKVFFGKEPHTLLPIGNEVAECIFPANTISRDMYLDSLNYMLIIDIENDSNFIYGTKILKPQFADSIRQKIKLLSR